MLLWVALTCTAKVDNGMAIVEKVIVKIAVDGTAIKFVTASTKTSPLHDKAIPEKPMGNEQKSVWRPRKICNVATETAYFKQN